MKSKKTVELPLHREEIERGKSKKMWSTKGKKLTKKKGQDEKREGLEKWEGASCGCLTLKKIKTNLRASAILRSK